MRVPGPSQFPEKWDIAQSYGVKSTFLGKFQGPGMLLREPKPLVAGNCRVLGTNVVLRHVDLLF